MNKAKLDQLRIERAPDTQVPGRRGWLVLIAIGLAATAAIAAFLLFRPGALAVRTVPVRSVTDPSPGTVLNASGYVTARRQATVSSEVTGKVVEVTIEEGMRVEEGQVLARLDDANIRAAYDLAEAQRVAAATSLSETSALLEEARANLRRTQNLIGRGLSSEAELDRARAQAESLAAQLERRKADIEVAGKNRAVWAEQLEDTIIRAPFSGVVVAKNAQPGEMISPVSAGGGFTRTGIGTIVDMTSLEIEIDVNEAYINRVSPGQKVVATLDAYPDWRIPCTVIAIIPTADRQRATVEVRVGFDELDPRILPDMGVKVAFQEAGEAAPQRAGWLVPAAALQQADGRNVVFVASGGVAERRAVRVGERQADDVVIEAGLGPGERVVLDPPAGLADGVRIEERRP